jgi:hypothetical protein
MPRAIDGRKSENVAARKALKRQAEMARKGLYVPQVQKRTKAREVQGITIDPEFEALIPPMAETSRIVLEASIVNEGCREPLMVWRQDEKDILVDGHNRFAICTKHNLPYRVRYKKFPSRESVMIWMIQNQRGRRNLTTYEAGRLALKEQEILSAIEKRIKGTMLYSGPVDPSPDSSNLKKKDTWKQASENNGVSIGTMHRAKEVQDNAPEGIRELVEKDEISLNAGYQISKALEHAHPRVKAVVDQWRVTDLGTIEILKRIHHEKRESFETVERTGFIQITDEKDAVSITAPSAQVQAALNKRAEMHRLMAVEETQAPTPFPAAIRIDDMIPTDSQWTIHEIDFRKVMRGMKASSLDAVMTHPILGPAETGLIDDMMREVRRVLKPGGSLIVVVPQNSLFEMMSRMRSHLSYQWTFAITPPEPITSSNKPPTFWRPALWHVKGSYGGQWPQDRVESKVDLVRLLTQPGDLIFDPFPQGGSFGEAAVREGRRWIGAAADPRTLQKIRNRLEALQNGEQMA